MWKAGSDRVRQAAGRRADLPGGQARDQGPAAEADVGDHHVGQPLGLRGLRRGRSVRLDPDPGRVVLVTDPEPTQAEREEAAKLLNRDDMPPPTADEVDQLVEAVEEGPEEAMTLDSRYKWVFPVKDVHGRDGTLGIGIEDGRVIVSAPRWFTFGDPRPCRAVRVQPGDRRLSGAWPVACPGGRSASLEVGGPGGE
jgi:hypothetical protein